LVPHQQPDAIVALIQQHLHEKGFPDIVIERLPGGYPPLMTATDNPFVTQVTAIGATVFERPPVVVPAGPYTVPFSLLVGHHPIPTVSLGLTPVVSATFAPDEYIPITDLSRHSRLLFELLDQLWR
jgi:acetylornithine deacetylase/succinyl-diaminopimelate desuccinylase-like protein